MEKLKVLGVELAQKRDGRGAWRCQAEEAAIEHKHKHLVHVN